MEKSNCYYENLELNSNENVFDFKMLKDISEDYVVCNFATSSTVSDVIVPKRRRIQIIESEDENPWKTLVNGEISSND